MSTTSFCFECGHDQPDHVAWCSANVPKPIDWTEPNRLARTSDPITSHAAAATITHTLTDHHRALLEWLTDHGPATDDQIAQAMVDNGLTNRSETARRWVRTLREEHGLVVAAIHNGHQIEYTNPSGRAALAWTTRKAPA